MAVTSRVPTYGKYPGYVEMRTVNAGEMSLVLARLWTLIEQVRFPWYTPSRLNCIQYLPYCSPPTQRLFTFFLDIHVPISYLLPVFNQEISSLLSSVLELVSPNASISPMETVTALSVALNIPIDQEDGEIGLRIDGNNVDLVYKRYEMDSFVVTKCGHIVPKTDFLGDFSICPYQNCHFPLSIPEISPEISIFPSLIPAIYSGTYISFIPTYISPKPTPNCVNCNRENSPNLCPNGCFMCEFCAIIAFFTPFRMKCLNCYEELRKNCWGNVVNWVKLVKKSEEMGVICEKCGQELPLNAFNEGFKDENVKFVCDFCYEIRKNPLDLQCFLCKFSGQYSNFTLFFDLGHSCQICDDCLTCSLYFPSKNLPCPLCFSPFPSNLPSKISQFLTFQHSNSPISPSICINSKAENAHNSCILTSKLAHECSICDNCLLKNTNMRQCFLCKIDYKEQEKRFLCLILPVLARKNGLCNCGNEANIGEIHCSNRCFCQECNLRWFLVSKKTECRECGEYCANLVQNGYKCSYCNKDLDVYSADFSRNVSGICAKGCVLCVFCVKLEEEKTECRCGGRVELVRKERREVSRTQEGFELGCYCGEMVGPRERLACGHEVHRDCLSTLSTCRLCPSSLQLPRSTLRSYTRRTK